MTRPVVASLAVIVPAHNEEERLGRCMEALAVARHRVRLDLPTLDVYIVVVLDRCTDRSSMVAADFDVTVVEVDEGCVGAARRAGVEAARARSTHDSEDVWLVHTDADSVVPADWLIDHYTLTGQHDLVIGRVVPDPIEIDDRRRVLWEGLHPVGVPSVHGANLGIRLSLYDAAGGFGAVSAHEDRLLVTAAVRTGATWTVGTSVTTSARLRGRAPEGFASYLRGLETSG